MNVVANKLENWMSPEHEGLRDIQRIQTISVDNGEPLRGFEQEKARLRTVIQREEFRNYMECGLVKKETRDYCNFLKKKKSIKTKVIDIQTTRQWK